MKLHGSGKHLARSLAIVAAAAMIAGTAPSSATAAPPGPASVALAADPEEKLPETDLEEKMRAAPLFDAALDDKVLFLSDREFVYQVWKRAAGAEVRAAALAAHESSDSDASTLFIRQGIFEAHERDKDAEKQADTARRQAREAKQRALTVLGLSTVESAPAMLELPDDEFIRQVALKVTWPWAHKVQAGIDQALRGRAAEWKSFIETGLIEAHRIDDEIEIERRHKENQEELAHQLDLSAKRRAAAVLAWVPTAGEIELPHDNFVRELWKRADAGSEVKADALAAMASADKADWKAYIYTGIYAASARDNAAELKAQAEADRRRATEIMARAENSLVLPALAKAARVALDGSDADVGRFLMFGQHQVLNQSLRSTSPGTKGLVVTGNGTTTALAGATPGSTVPNATWKVVEGLGDDDCFSLESPTRPGYYLRHQNLRVKLLPSDGSTAFKGDATWCVKKAGSAVSFEAHSAPGHFLRQLGTELWAATGKGAKRQDRACLFPANTAWAIGGPDPQATQAGPDRDPCHDQGPGAANSPDKNLQVADIAADGSLHYWAYDFGQGKWAVKDVSLGGSQLIGSPSVEISSNKQVQILATRDDGSLRYWVQQNGDWIMKNHNLGGTDLASSPTAFTSSDGNFQIFAVGRDGGLHYWVYDYSLKKWAASDRNLGGTDLVGRPAAMSSKNGNLEIYALATDGSLRHWAYDFAKTRTWISQNKNLGGDNLIGSPTSVLDSDGNQAIFALAGDGSLRRWRYDAKGGTGWSVRNENIGGTSLTGAPSVMNSKDGDLHVFVAHTDGGLRQWSYDINGARSWKKDQKLGGLLIGAVDASQSSDGNTQVFGTGADASLRNFAYDASGGKGWAVKDQNLGGSVS